MQVTIISGASRGIGKAIAEDLKSIANYDDHIIKLSSSDVDFEDYNKVYDYVAGLVYSSDLVYEIDQINLILCAAQIGTANSINLDELNKLYKINVLGNLAAINAILPLKTTMRIVWFAGGGAAFPYPEFFGYSLSKVAVSRAVENLSLILPKYSSIIALAPGAVDTDMLKTVLEAGCEVRTHTDISESVSFVRKFVTDEVDTVWLNGKFIHVRDDINRHKKDIYKLRRIE